MLPDNAKKHLTTLQDVYYAWLEMAQPKRNGRKNRERKPNDLKNHERALRCLAAGANGGRDDLDLLPPETLYVDSHLLGRYVEAGAAALNANKKRGAPSEKTIKNLISCCKAIRTAIGAGDRPSTESLFQCMRKTPKRRYRKAFYKAAWPEALRHDFQGYAAWKTKPILSPEEGDRYRRLVCRPVTVRSHERTVNWYLGYLVRERGFSVASLNDLCQLNLYADYLNWYLDQDADGGYHTAKMTGTVLGTISQYLVAMGRLPQKGPGGKDVWEEFYALGDRALEIGAKRGELPERGNIGHWTPTDFLDLARRAWNTPTPRYKRGDDWCYQKQCHNRLRSGLFFMLAYETPLRARNFIEMRWGKNLKKNADGFYELHFRGLELKVANRGYHTNEYRHTYSEEASGYIDRWRERLRSLLGDDFEERCPYVFASSSLSSKPVDYNGFNHYISRLVLELRGETFNPHKVRHIVASYLVKEMKGGHNLAARLLGNKKETVLSTYDRPNNEEALQEYLEKRRLGKI